MTAIRELGLNDELMVTELLDVFEPNWTDELAPGASGPRAFVADPQSFMLGAYIDNDPVGWALGGQWRGPTGELTLTVQSLEVVASARRRGVGTSLLEAAIGLARRQGASALTIVAAANSPGHAFCDHIGGRGLRKPDTVDFEWRLR